MKGIEPINNIMKLSVQARKLFNIKIICTLPFKPRDHDHMVCYLMFVRYRELFLRYGAFKDECSLFLRYGAFKDECSLFLLFR